MPAKTKEQRKASRLRVKQRLNNARQELLTRAMATGNFRGLTLSPDEYSILAGHSRRTTDREIRANRIPVVRLSARRLGIPGVFAQTKLIGAPA
jgi:hypothetical protein